jgi:hypothetical protein
LSFSFAPFASADEAAFHSASHPMAVAVRANFIRRIACGRDSAGRFDRFASLPDKRRTRRALDSSAADCGRGTASIG